MKDNTTWVLSVAVVIIMVLVVIVVAFWQPWASGEKRWETYNGIVKEFNIDCSECCHPSSYFVIKTSRGTITEHIGDCDESLNGLIDVGSYYTIRLEPYVEPSAIDTSCWWAVKIDWVKDSSGTVIYGSEFF